MMKYRKTKEEYIEQIIDQGRKGWCFGRTTIDLIGKFN